MNNHCPKCHRKISPFYLKQHCPYCQVDLLYYQLEERLEKDAQEAARQEVQIKRFADTVKASSIASPLHVIRLILFFTPLLSMCLPMYRAGHKTVSLIGIIASIINHGFDISVWSTDYLFAVLAIAFVILLSLAVIINSFFSVTEHGTLRNFIFSLINTAIYGILSVLVCVSGGAVLVGFYVTLAIYFVELLLHFFIGKKELKFLLAISAVLCAMIAAVCSFTSTSKVNYPVTAHQAGISVVSFNTAAPWGTPFDGTASADRVQRFADYMACISPSLIGTQELNSSWLEFINNRMPEYVSYAVKRGDEDENKSEMNGIFWRKDEFTAIETNTFWLSQTPDRESRFMYMNEDGEEESAGCNRICTYAILSENSTGRKIAFLNTHLDNANAQAIEFGATLIAKKIQSIEAEYTGITVILSGDFNQTDDGIAYQILSEVLNDTTDKKIQAATYQDWGYTDTGDKPIDFIFTNAVSQNYQILDNLDEGYISDHFGIYTTIQ